MPAPKLLFANTIIIEGQVAGSWRRTIQNDAIDLEYHLFNPLHKKNVTVVNQAIKQFSKFMELPVIKFEK